MKKFFLPILFLFLTIIANGQEAGKTKVQEPSAQPAMIIIPPPPGGGETYYWNRDNDGDGYGDPNDQVESATKPMGYVANPNDCDDTDPTVWFDCSGGGTPPAVPFLIRVFNYCGYTKLTRGTPPNGVTYYWQSTSTGTSTSNSSLSINRYSGNIYYLRARDNGSLEWSDDRSVTYSIDQSTLWYADSDGDGFGDPGTSQSSCDQPSGYVADNSDTCPNDPGPVNGCPDPSGSTTFSNENYVFTRTYKNGFPSAPAAPSTADVIEEITYYDGLGRPMQQIGINQSPQEEDIITHFDYDGYGKQDKSFLPYPEENVNAGDYYSGNILYKIQSYYKSNYSNDFLNENISNTNPYSQSLYAASPLSRVLKKAAPGKDWKLGQGNEIEYEYATNTVEDDVRQFYINFPNGTEEPKLSAHYYRYSEGKLYKITTKNENHTLGKLHSTEIFKDFEGKIILKRKYANVAGIIEEHDLYYVYDHYDNLTFVITPKVVIEDGISTLEMNNLCFQYKYDHRNRLIEKKIPGKDWEYIVYNELSQPILTQDPNLRNNDFWLYKKYDALGRVVITGIYSSPLDRINLQAAVDAYYNQSSAKLWEEKTTSSVYNYYTNHCFPTSAANSEVLTLNYYDNYNFSIPMGLKLPNQTSIFDDQVDYNVRDLLTGSKIKVLDQNVWITKINHYDNKGRMIYTASYNDFLNTTFKFKHDLNFMGIIKKTESYHKKGSNAAITVTDNFTYDHVNRLLNHTQTIGGHTELIAKNIYDELGNLTQKLVGNTSSNPLQEIDYAYNVRGWLEKINDPFNSGSDLFNCKISYNSTNLSGSTPLYNGNISEIVWKTANDVISMPSNFNRAYNYQYDALNRLNSAKYFQKNSSGNYQAYKFRLQNITYDKNGNLLSLERGGYANYYLIDALVYTYGGGNKLMKVRDNGTSYVKHEGFVNGTNTGNDYAYDNNGNLISDANKGITNISYNHLNLPTNISINGGTIEYIYDAIGAKQKKIVSKNGNTNITEYAGNFIYENSSLKLYSQPEGYWQPDGNGGFDYIYNYKDHVGNIRLSYSDSNGDGNIDPTTEILDEKNYYPFGMQHKGYNNNVVGAENNRKTYQGKELEKAIGLNWHDFGARRYMADIGRWISPDPLAGEFPNWSPYTAMNDNPINFIDPDGQSVLNPHDGLVWRKPIDHWKLNSAGKLVLIKRTNDDFNVFFDENGHKLFQTNELSYEMTSEYWSTRIDEYTNKMKTVFIEMATEPEVYNTMKQRASEIGFDDSFMSLKDMKAQGEYLMDIGPIIAVLDAAKEAPKWAASPSSAAKDIIGQAVEGIYKGAKGTDLRKDIGKHFNRAMQGIKTFWKDLSDGSLFRYLY